MRACHVNVMDEYDLALLVSEVDVSLDDFEGRIGL